MARPSKKSPDEKMRVVLSVLRGEVTVAEAGRKAGVSEQTVSNSRVPRVRSGRSRSRQPAPPVEPRTRARS